MSNIDIKNISDLDLNGNDLFQDSESFITELTTEINDESIMGGGSCFHTEIIVPCTSLTDYQFTDSTVRL